MGALAVLAMVDQVSPPRHGGAQPLHPFFQSNKPAATGATETSSTRNSRESTTNTSMCSFDGTTNDGSDDSGTSAERGAQRWKRSKLDSQVPEDVQKQRVAKRIKISPGGNITHHFTRPHEDNSPSPSAIDENPQQPGDEAIGRHGDGRISEPKATRDNQHTPPISTNLAATSNAEPPRPMKVIRLNLKTGTLGSPPKPKAPLTDVEREVTKKACSNGRGKMKPPRILRIKYGTDADSRIRIGDKVNAILNSYQAWSTGSLSTNKSQRSEPKKPAHREPSKTTHPFFLGNPKPPKPSPGPAVPKVESSKICQVGEPVPVDNAPKKSRATSTRMPQFGAKSTGLKVPGSKLPAWPWKGMVHVRGEDSGASPAPEEPTPSLSSRKSKGRVVEIPARESVVEYATQRLDIPGLKVAAQNENTDDFLPPLPVVRLPQKHFESGRKLQQRILPELRCSKQTIAGRKGVEGQINVLDHPAPLLRLFNSIQSELPAVDRSECETLSWVQKYAPITAAEVLQPGREAFFLKEWLQALMVQSVDTGSGDGEKGKASLPKSKVSGPAKKRRKKLDDFIVSSDEEADQVDEASETEGDWAASGTHGILRKTVIRAGGLKGHGGLKDSSRLANTVVISGPHGSGKTAAVYAVAKELGFEVFEINSSSRRSGKDVLDRIGDMTRNHLVSHRRRGNAEPNTETEEDSATAALESGVADDIKSGKQATMGSFFKPKAVGNPEKPTKQAGTCPAQSEAGKDAPKGQKQSLILLDEADILYEEDKQFWASVIGLMAQSRRPFIVTCNDETLLPLQNLTLHGIFRLSHPPTDLAVDRLILIAANEGHALRRDGVEALFESRNRDLRAATMDLNYWCQIGVGDRRGGFDWFYLRWPKGIDLDENKEVVRVVSEGTYQPGMNWLVRDHVVDNAAHPSVVEEELLQQVWSSWNLDIDQWQGSASMLPWTKGLSTVPSEPSGRLAALEAFDQFAETMSASDICSSTAFGRSIEVCFPAFINIHLALTPLGADRRHAPGCFKQSP